MPSQWPLPFPTTSGFGFSHHAVCCFPVTFVSRRLAAHRLESCKFFSMQCRAEGILQARLVRTENGRKQKKGWQLPQPMRSGLFSPFWGFALGIDGHRPGYRSEALSPSLLSRNPVRQRTKGVEEQKKGGKKGEREREMDDKEVGPWPAIHNPQLGYHPSKGTWTPAHDLHQKSFFLHVRCLKVFNGVSLLKVPYPFTQ